MSLEDYQQFVFKACKLYDEDPKKSWLKVRERQQHIVEYLNEVDEMVYKNPLSEITFSMKDRIWMNSDGQTNMPSGEVYSTPVEDAVNGVIHFDYPSIFRGHPIEGITLEVKDGLVVKWDAKVGKQLLDDVFAIEGARTFGEVAIGGGGVPTIFSHPAAARRSDTRRLTPTPAAVATDHPMASGHETERSAGLGGASRLRSHTFDRRFLVMTAVRSPATVLRAFHMIFDM